MQKFGDYLCGLQQPLLRWNALKRCLDVITPDMDDEDDAARERRYSRRMSSVSRRMSSVSRRMSSASRRMSSVSCRMSSISVSEVSLLNVLM